jgi:hypothetical protein
MASNDETSIRRTLRFGIYSVSRIIDDERSIFEDKHRDCSSGSARKIPSYHSHDDSLIQMGRGLAGALIVEEAEPA